MSEDAMLWSVLPHYGSVDRGTCWFYTYYPTFTEELKMLPADIDPCLLFKKAPKTNGPLGITGLVADETINTGKDQYFNSEE